MEPPDTTKPSLFTIGRVPWWSVVVFLIVIGLIVAFSDDLVRPAY